jgi:hypothetical protein
MSDLLLALGAGIAGYEAINMQGGGVPQGDGRHPFLMKNKLRRLAAAGRPQKGRRAHITVSF